MTRPTLVDRVLAKGDQLYESGDYDAALAEYSRATLLAPDSAIAFEKCGHTYLAKDNCAEDARRHFQKAVELDPRRATAHHGLGRAVSKLKDPEAAVKAFEAAIASDNTFADAYYELGEALYKLKKFDEAGEQYERLISLSTPAAEAIKGMAFNRWGATLVMRRRPQDALSKYELAYEAGLRLPNLFHNWAVALRRLDRIEEAIAKYKEAIERDHDGKLYATHNNLGRIYDELYKDDEALKEFQLAAREGSDYPAIALNNWGNVLLRLRRYSEALEKYQESIKCDPNYTKAYYNRAFLLWQQGKHKEAKKAWKEALKVFVALEAEATEAEHFRLCGTIYHEIFQDPWCAEKAYLKALSLSSEDLDVLLSLITFYVQQRDAAVDVDEKNSAQVNVDIHFRNAKRVLNSRLKEAAEKRKDDTSLRIREGKLYQAVAKYAEAEKAYLKALEALRNSGKSLELQGIYAGLGSCYVQQDEYKKGAGYLEQALQENPDDLFIRSRLAETYRRMNDFTRAERKYDEVFNVSISHVESHLGRGELYKTLGDNGEVEMYDDAIRFFSDALALSKSEDGSKVLTSKELAALYYSRGYASVKLYENTKPARGESLLRAALSDFEASHKKDKNNFRAKRAAEKLRLRLSYTRSQSILKSIGPFFLFLLSVLVFFLTQYVFFTSKPIVWDDTAKIMKVMSESHYALLTFGSIIFMIAGLSLPELLKIKIAGVELEKSSIEQVQPFSSLGISKG